MFEEILALKDVKTLSAEHCWKFILRHVPATALIEFILDTERECYKSGFSSGKKSVQKAVKDLLNV